MFILNTHTLMSLELYIQVDRIVIDLITSSFFTYPARVKETMLIM